MGLTINCRDIAHYKQSNIEEGTIYVYKEAINQTKIIHRLVKDCRKGCYGLIFKGDNNMIGEIVNESQILGKVTRVDYYR